MTARPETTVPTPFAVENTPPLTTVFILTHTDARDYYHAEVTTLGVFSTQEKAEAFREGVRDKYEEGGDDLFFHIAAIALDPEAR